jgi:hypothetical protein
MRAGENKKMTEKIETKSEITLPVTTLAENYSQIEQQQNKQESERLAIRNKLTKSMADLRAMTDEQIRVANLPNSNWDGGLLIAESNFRDALSKAYNHHSIPSYYRREAFSAHFNDIHKKCLSRKLTQAEYQHLRDAPRETLIDEADILMNETKKKLKRATKEREKNSKLIDKINSFVERTEQGFRETGDVLLVRAGAIAAPLTTYAALLAAPTSPSNSIFLATIATIPSALAGVGIAELVWETYWNKSYSKHIDKKVEAGEIEDRRYDMKYESFGELLGSRYRCSKNLDGKKNEERK